MHKLLAGPLVASSLVLLLSNASAQAVCDSVLRPTEDRSTDGNFALYSYVNTYAEEEYARLQQLRGDQLNFDATYKVFSGAFKASRTKSEFRDNVRRMMQQTGYTRIENRVKSSHRVGLQDTQISAWENCMANHSGGLSIVAGDVTRAGFTLRGTWRPPMGHSADTVTVRLVGGTTTQSGREVMNIDIPVSGARNFRLAVNTAPGSRDIRVIAQTSAFGDDILVPVQPPIRRVESVVQECVEQDPCPENAKVIDCLTSDDKPREVAGNRWLFGTDSVTSGNYAARNITFGNWSNSQCGLSGNGWHTPIGSCEKRAGAGLQRCTKVRVQVERVTFADQ